MTTSRAVRIGEGTMKSTRPTLRDVAGRAGVSTITVSRALSRSSAVATKTQQRIEAAAQEIGYVPNLAASSLSSKRTYIIGALISTLASELFTETIRGLELELRRGGYHLILGETQYSKVEETRLLRAMLGRRPDGIVLSSKLHTAEAHQLLKSFRVPVVEIWDLPNNPINAAIGFSNFDGGYKVGCHFAHCGYAPVGYAAGDDERSEGKWSGFRQAIVERTGREPVRILLEPEHQLNFKRGGEALDRILMLDTPCRAIFCGDDVTAASILFECGRRGIDVPKDLALCGFGDVPIAQAVHPRLTTIHIPFAEIGCTAGWMITRLAEREALAESVVELKTKLVVRETTSESSA